MSKIFSTSKQIASGLSIVFDFLRSQFPRLTRKGVVFVTVIASICGIASLYYAKYPQKNKAKLSISGDVIATNDMRNLIFTISNQGDQVARITYAKLSYEGSGRRVSCQLSISQEKSYSQGMSATHIEFPIDECGSFPKPLTPDLKAYFDTDEKQKVGGWSKTCLLTIGFEEAGVEKEHELISKMYSCADHAPEQPMRIWHLANKTFIQDKNGSSFMGNGKVLYSPSRGEIEGAVEIFKIESGNSDSSCKDD